MEDIGLYGLTLMVTMLGYFLHSISQDLKDIQKEHNHCKEGLPLIYVLKEDYKHDIDEIKKMMGKIYDKLDENK